MQIILASSSPFRKELLNRLHIEYDSISPDIDESQFNDETPSDYVKRLAFEKANVIAEQYPDAVVIGSDQCAVIEEKVLDKPGSFENALAQLKFAQGKTAVFHTGLCVLQKNSQLKLIDNILYEVAFRELSDEQLTRYIHVDEPLNCAGSFKSEAYGVTLFSKMSGDDPSALMGLPLIKTIEFLEKAQVKII